MKYVFNPLTGNFDLVSDLSGYLALDQTTPQTVINGTPIFSEGIIGGNTRINGDGIDFKLSANTDMYLQNYGVEKGFIFTSSDGIGGQTTLLDLDAITGANFQSFDITTTGDITGGNLNISNWDTAYGWGNHASAGYLTSVTAHNLLSATHGDTLAGSVVAGDLLYGNSTPKWARLAKGTDGHVLTLVSGLPAWAAPAGGSSVSFGTTTQIPYMNAGGTDFLYGDLKFNGTNLLLPDNKGIVFGTGSDTRLYTNSSNHFYIENDTSNADIFIKVNDGGVDTTLVQFDSSLSRTKFPVNANITNPISIDGSAYPYDGYFTATAFNVTRYTDTGAMGCTLRGFAFDIRNQRQIYSEYDYGEISNITYGIQANVTRGGGMSGEEEYYSEANYGASYAMTVGGNCSMACDELIAVFSYGVENSLIQNYAADGVEMSTKDYGGKFTVNLSQTSPEINGGTMYSDAYGFYTDVLVSANRTAGYMNAYGAYILVNAASGVNAYGLYITGGAGSQTIKNFLGEDNVKTFVGTAFDASFYYDATDFCIDTAEVGSGTLNLVSQTASAITTETIAEYVTIKIGGVAKKIAIVS